MLIKLTLKVNTKTARDIERFIEKITPLFHVVVSTGIVQNKTPPDIGEYRGYITIVMSDEEENEDG